ncbi:uncharacterized protein LOC119835922 isoform X2 [Zerene cesonia]|uniref:uncharacterized protein LOC119835922 isoform X2 n=1 Tax=Zerene cesonia TaxID=33412 RepID=UPI0018E5328E|nr:uncharacterized protein LOC119835922 isoform X2 [Zerene cesonia]
MGSNCCKGDAAGKPVVRSNSSIYSRSRAGATLDNRFKTSVDAGGVRLTVSAARTGDSGVYTLQASNAAGKDSTRVTLEVSPDEMPTGDDPPTFLRRLQDLTVKVGTRTRFLVEIVSSTECKVTWYRNERRLLEAERIALVRDGNFWCADVATVSADDAGRWTCTAENLGGRASCSAHLNVLVPKAYKRPEFVEELRAILTEQGTVSLECKVVGVPTPVLRWFKDSCEIKAGDVFALTANAEDPTSLGTYTCEAVNCMGRAYSSSKVHVIGRAKEGASPSSGGVTPDPPPIFTKELEDQFVRICDPLNLSCHIVVPPWPRSVVWYNKEGKIEGSMKYHIQEDGVGGYLLEVSGAEWADEGEWKCVATSAGGRVGISTCNVTMDVPKNYRKPRFMENLQAVLTEEGLVSFECKVVGFPTPVLSWFKDGQELKPGDVYQLTGTNSLGSYCCIAKNCMGQASSSAELTVEDIQNQLNEEEKLQLFSKNQAPKFLQGLKSVEVKIDEPFRFTIKVAIPPEPTVLWYRDDQPVDESPRCHLGTEDRGVFYLDIKNLELMDQTEWKCVAMNDFGHSVTSCFLKLIIPRHFKKPRFLENLQAILSDEGAVNLECKVIGVPQPVLKWYKDGEELKPGDIHRIISGQDGTCCLGTYTCEAQNCMGIAASSASLLGFEDTVKAKNKKKVEEQTLQRNLSLSTIHEERTSQMYDTPVGDITLDDKGEISFSFDGKEVSVSLYETPDLTEEEALQIVEMYADQLSENVTEHNVVELPPLRFVKETSTSGNLLMEAIIIDVSPDYFVNPEEDLRTDADIEDISIAEENGHAHLSFDQDVGEDYLEKTMAMLSEEKSDIPVRIPRRKSDSQKSADDYFSLSKDPSLSEEKKDDDTQMLSESASFASARSAEKINSPKPSQDDEIVTQESSDVTKTVMLREEHRNNVPTEDIPELKVSIECGQNLTTDGVPESENLIPMKMGAQHLEKLNQNVTQMSAILSRIMNNIQVTERDIILKSQLMSTAAIASKSLEIINSLITPLNEIHSITDAIKESILESAEINNNLFIKLPDCLKEFQKSLTMVEKCVDVGSDKTFIKNTCISVIKKCDEDITNFTSKIKAVVEEDLTFMGDEFVSDISSSTNDILNVIKIARSTIASKSIFDEAPIKDEMSVDIQHLNDTQKAIYDLKIPLNSLLNIVENALKSIVINSIDINDAEVILINMSASIQDLQTALEHIELLSVEESNSTLQKYNTNIIETVMGSVLKLRTSFESLSMEKEKRDDREELKNDLQLIKVNLNEISAHVDQIENKIGTFDVLHGDNKLEVLQKMAHILISLENSLPTLYLLPHVQNTMTLFHKYLTKALENVIESNETAKYLTLVRICDAVNRINASIKNIESSKLLSLASIGNNFCIIEDIVKNNDLRPDLNNEIILIVNQYFNDIQNIITYTEDENVKIDFESAKDISNNSSYGESKAVIVMHQIEQAIAVIQKIIPEEATSNINTIYPTLESICPILEDLKYSIASFKENEQEHNSHLSDMSEHEIVEMFGKPLQDLRENITILHTLLLESAEDSKTKNEIMAMVAEPLHELHNTLQIMQENVISQYESLSSLHANIDVASTAQILENCFLIVQEQHDLEPVEEISTLEDISGIKTTAESILSDHLIQPTENKVNVELALETPTPKSEVLKILKVLHETLSELESSEVIKVIEKLSEINELVFLKNVPESILQLNREIQTLLPPSIREENTTICNVNLDSLTTISQTLDNWLTVIESHEISKYQDILQVSPDKIQLVSNSISDLKINLSKLNNVIDDRPNKDLQVAINANYFNKLGENYKMCLKDAVELNLVEYFYVDDLKSLENSVENFLKAVNAPDATDNDNNMRMVSEKLYEDILKVQDELIFYAVQPLQTAKQDYEILNIVNELANNLTVIQPHVTDVSKMFDIDYDVYQHCDILKETDSLKDMEDVIKTSIEFFKDPAKETPISSDLKKVELLFENCKSSFSVLRCLLNQRPSQKKIIRLVQEFSVLQNNIIDFKNIKNDLNLSQDIQTCLDNFLIQTEKSIQNIKTSLIKIVSSVSKTLFKKPLGNIKETLECISKFSLESSLKESHEVIQTFKNILHVAHTHMINLEEDVLQEIQNEYSSYKKDKEQDLLIESISNFMDLLEIQKATTTNEDVKIILNKMLICIRKHQDYKIATGTVKKMILLKCLSDCSTFMNQLIEHESNKLLTKLNDNESVKNALCLLMQPLDNLHLELNKLKETKLLEPLVPIVPADTFNLCVQTINQIGQAIDEYTTSNSAEFDDEDLAKKIDDKLDSIQEIVHTLQSTHGSAYLADVFTAVENTKECISRLSQNKKMGIEHKVPKEKTEALLQHMEQYIEITEIIEEISAIINVSDVKEAKKIAQELRESIASSEIIPDTATAQVKYHIVTEDQENLVQQLQKSLLEIQEQASESSHDLSGHNKDVKQQVIEVISQLQEDLNVITNVQAPIEFSDKKMAAKESNKIENLDSVSMLYPEEKCSGMQNDDVIDTDEMRSHGDMPESNVPQNNQAIHLENTTLIVTDSTESFEVIPVIHGKQLSNISEIVSEGHKAIELSTESQSDEYKANIAVHQIEEAIIAINNIDFEEASIHSNEILPVFDSICPILEELKCNIASLQHNSLTDELNTSVMSDFDVEQFFIKPLCKLHENIIVLNQVLMDSVKDSVENINEATGVFAKPLQELHNTLEILQENVISQYESLSSLHENVNIATTTQILQSCCLLVQEQHEVEAVEDISTLDELSALKTTADSISSEVLGIAEEAMAITMECGDIDKVHEDNENKQQTYSSSMDYIDNQIHKDVSLETKTNIELLEKHDTEQDDILKSLVNDQCKYTDESLCEPSVPECTILHGDTTLEENKENAKLEIESNDVEDTNLKIPTEVKMDSMQQEVDVMADKENTEQNYAVNPNTTLHDVTLEICNLVSEQSHEISEDIRKYELPDNKIDSPNEEIVTVEQPNLVIESKLKDEYEISTDASSPTKIVHEIIDVNTNQTENDATEISENIDASLNVNEFDTINLNLGESETFQPTTIQYEEVIQNMETLLVELKHNLDLSTISIVDNADLLQNLLDEFQIEVIKLKSENNTEVNDALTETLNDLECSVRSVQLQVSEKSPPEHIIEASATLQLLVSTIKDVLHATASSEIVEVNDKNILQDCVGETENTIILLDKVSDTKKDEEDILNIIKSLNSIRDTIKETKQSFSVDENTLIDKGIDILQNLEIIENQLFAIENEIDKVKNVDITTRDTIITAIHSVYSSISNMRGTITSIQKRYIYQNFGKPSENILNAIKNINNLSKLDKKHNWIEVSKYLRKTLNHFEDVKFYINLDKTARLPSDATLTKVVLNELKILITDIILSNIIELNIPLVNEVNGLIIKVSEKIDKIANQSILEVKDKIPIFKEISSEVFEVSKSLKQYYESHFTEGIPASNVSNNDILSKTEHALILSDVLEKKEVRLEENKEKEIAEPLISGNLNENSMSESDGEQHLRENVQPFIVSLIDEAIDKVKNSMDSVKTGVNLNSISRLDLMDQNNEERNIRPLDPENEILKISEVTELQDIVSNDAENEDNKITIEMVSSDSTLNTQRNENEQTIQLRMKEDTYEIEENNNLRNDEQNIDKAVEIKQITVDETNIPSQSLVSESNESAPTFINLDKQESDNNQQNNLPSEQNKNGMKTITDPLKNESIKNVDEKVDTSMKDKYSSCETHEEEKNTLTEENLHDLLLTSEVILEPEEKNPIDTIQSVTVDDIESSQSVEVSVNKDIDGTDKQIKNKIDLLVIDEAPQNSTLLNNSEDENMTIGNVKLNEQENINKDDEFVHTDEQTHDIHLSIENELDVNDKTSAIDFRPNTEIDIKEINLSKENQNGVETTTKTTDSRIIKDNILQENDKENLKDVSDAHSKDVAESTKELDELPSSLAPEGKKHLDISQAQITDENVAFIKSSTIISTDTDGLKKECDSDLLSTDTQHEQIQIISEENEYEEISDKIVCSSKLQHEEETNLNLSRHQEVQKVSGNQNIQLSAQPEFTDERNIESICPEISDIHTRNIKTDSTDDMTNHEMLNNNKCIESTIQDPKYDENTKTIVVTDVLVTELSNLKQTTPDVEVICDLENPREESVINNTIYANTKEKDLMEESHAIDYPEDIFDATIETTSSITNIKDQKTSMKTVKMSNEEMEFEKSQRKEKESENGNNSVNKINDSIDVNNMYGETLPQNILKADEDKSNITDADNVLAAINREKEKSIELQVKKKEDENLKDTSSGSNIHLRDVDMQSELKQNDDSNKTEDHLEETLKDHKFKRGKEKTEVAIDAHSVLTAANKEKENIIELQADETEDKTLKAASSDHNNKTGIQELSHLEETINDNKLKQDKDNANKTNDADEVFSVTNNEKENLSELQVKAEHETLKIASQEDTFVDGTTAMDLQYQKVLQQDDDTNRTSNGSTMVEGHELSHVQETLKSDNSEADINKIEKTYDADGVLTATNKEKENMIPLRIHASEEETAKIESQEDVAQVNTIAVNVQSQIDLQQHENDNKADDQDLTSHSKENQIIESLQNKISSTDQDTTSRNSSHEAQKIDEEINKPIKQSGDNQKTDNENLKTKTKPKDKRKGRDKKDGTVKEINENVIKKDSIDPNQDSESVVTSKFLNNNDTDNVLKDIPNSEKVELKETHKINNSVTEDQTNLVKNPDDNNVVSLNENQTLEMEKQEYSSDKNKVTIEQKAEESIEVAVELKNEKNETEKDDGKNKSKSDKKRSSLEKKDNQKKLKLKQKEVVSPIETQNNINDSKTDNDSSQMISCQYKNETYEQKNTEEKGKNYEVKEIDICEQNQRSREIKQNAGETFVMADICQMHARSNEDDQTSFIDNQKYVIRDKPIFNEPNLVDPSMEFSRPPTYVGKPYDSDNNKLLPEVNTYSSTSKVFYKAQSLVRDHQLRSPSIMDNDNKSDSRDKSEMRLKSKAMSETRTVSEKRVGSSRDLKRKPVFSTHLTNRTAVEGSRVKLTCSVLSSTEPVLKWYKNGVPLDDKQKYKIKFTDGLITMELLNAIPSDSGDYSCTVENEHGSVTTSAKLKVYPSFEPSPIPPTFTRSIRDVYHFAENELVLECRIRGQPLPTITWIKDNQPIGADSRFEAAYLADGLCRLTISNPTAEDSGTYTCKAESSMWTDQITHVVQFSGKESRVSPHLSNVDKSRHIPDTRRPHFTNVLSDYKVVKGGTIGLQVEIGGAPTRVEWLREGSCVTELYRNAQTFVDHGIYTLALSDVTEKHSGLYTCRAWSTHGNVDMNADITVVQPSEVEGKPAVIVSRPAKDVLISIGEDINISFRVQGEPRPKVMFMKGIRDITNSQRVCKMTSDDYVKFTLKRSVISDAGTYCVLARNAYGCDRAFITVVVRQRASSENLISDWTYPMDDQAIVASDRKYKSVPGRIPGEPSAVDGGNNWLTLAWPKPDPNAAAPVLAYRVDSWLLGKDGGARWVEMGITPRNTFDAFNLKQGEEYHFRVTPRNRYGWGEPVQTTVPVGVGISGDRPEFIDILPGLLKVLVGETANLSCSFKGKPTPEIVWMKNGHEIEETNRLRSLQSGNVCSLKIQDVKIEDEGRYSCEATNVHGRASTYARMTVITDRQIWEADAKLKRERSADAEGEYPPQFTMRLRDRRVQATYPVRLTCQVIGSPAPNVTWFKDGQEVVLDSRRVKYQDEHFHTLEIAPTTLDDGGVYEALARNGSGAISCRCSLVVDKGIRAYVAPDFCCGLEPSYRLNEGEELRISAIVEAYPSVGVTWYRDGVRLRPSRKTVMTLNRDGQIELALASVTSRDAGVYTCTASNEVGQASTSGKVEIVTGDRQDQRSLPTVICPDVPYSKEPMFLKKPRSTEAHEGDTVIIECEVIGDPTPDVYWLRDFLKPDYYRDANHFKQMAAGPVYRFEIPHAKLDYTGAYSVVARNVHGEAKAIISLQIFAKDLRSSDDTHNIRYGRVEVIPRFEKELTDLLCYDGDAVEFECRVSGNPEPDIRWFHYSEVLPECADFETTFEVGTARLKIKQVAAEDEGTYTCEASNNLGKATSKACLVVYPPGEPNTLSQRLQRPPALSSAASTPRSTPRTTPARSVSRTPGPEVRKLRSPTREIAPKFYTYPFNKVVEEGESVVFQCAVGGLPPPWATWDKDGIIITPTSRISIKEKDEMLRILQIDEVTIEDVGLYRITLENEYGRVEASARLEVISHKGKFYAGGRSCSASPRRMMSYNRRTPSYSRQD